MIYPWIGYDNFFAQGTVTASTTASGFDASYVADGLTFTRWRNDPAGEGDATQAYISVDLGSGVELTPDYLAVSGHNLGTNGAKFQLYWSDDGAAWTAYTAFPATGSLVSDHTQGLNVTTAPGDHRHWRVELLFLDTYAEIGALWLGRKLDMTEYMAQGFDPHDLKLQSRHARSRNGTFLGSVVDYVEQNVSLKITDGGIDSDWFDDTGTPSWDDFLRTHWSYGRPWIFKWTDGYDVLTGSATWPAWYCWPDERARSRAPYKTGSRRDWRFDFNVLAEGYPS